MSTDINNIDVITIGLAFIEGFALIISPCILPILPIILSGSITGNRVRPFGIILGFIMTFTLVTLFSRELIAYTHISADVIRNVSFIILLLLGILMMSTCLTEKFNFLTQRLTHVGHSLSTINNPQSGFWSGCIFGGLVGIIWTPCAGPILAAVIVQVVIQQTTLNSILVVIAFAIGAGLPMLLIALIGRQVMNKFNFFRERAFWLRKLLGLIIILSVIFLIYSNTSISFSSTQTTHPLSSPTTLVNGLEKPYKAPEIAGIDAWLNSPPLQLTQLQGKVVLIDFWTYSCINCIRTLPYLKDWYAKYHDKGFEIIGVHSPEFAFEHNLDNVKNAVANNGILYPVALDNHFVTWQNYHNEYWPAHYLINQKGDVVYEHFGEGEYDITENNIRFLLGLSGQMRSISAEEKYSSWQTPETYLGYARADVFSSPEVVTKDEPAVYSYPAALPQDSWALKGKWIIYADRIVSASRGASVQIHFYASKVYAVMGTSNNRINVSILLNGQPLNDEQGVSVSNSQIPIISHQLYSIINLKKESEGILEFIATSPGLEIYTFTFGD